MKISRLAHVALYGPDTAELARFYRVLYGLTESHAAGDSVFLSGGIYGSFDLQLIAGDGPRMDHFAFSVASAADIVEARERLGAAGVAVADADLALEPGIAEGIDFELPCGLRMQLVLESDPVQYTFGRTHGLDHLTGIGPVPLDHVNFTSHALKEDVDFLVEHLDFTFTDALRPTPDKWLLGFTRCGERHHDIAFSGVGPERQPALHHLAWEVSSFDAIVRACDLVAEMGLELDCSPGRHMLGGQLYVYYRDPAGNRNELVCGMAIVDAAAETRILTEERFDVWRPGLPPEVVGSP